MFSLKRLIIWWWLPVVVHFLPLDVALVVALVGVAIIVVVLHVVKVAMMFHLHIDHRRRSWRMGAKRPVVFPGPAVVVESPVVVLLVVGEVVPWRDLRLGLSLLLRLSLLLVGDWDFGLGRSRWRCLDFLIHILNEGNLLNYLCAQQIEFHWHRYFLMANSAAAKIRTMVT